MPRKTKADGGALGDIAESLGTFLGHAEAKWRSWHGEREAMVKAVTAVRDRATALLHEMGESGVPKAAKAARAVASAAGGAVKAAKKIGRRSFTPAQRAEAAARMKKSWVDRRKRESKGK